MNGYAKDVFSKLKEEARSGYVFPSPGKRGTHLGSIKKGFQFTLEAAGIRDFHVHDLRHTFGTRASDRGVAITAIADVMGHADIKTTQQYSHATDEGRCRVVERWRPVH